jgi:hypothetical protein
MVLMKSDHNNQMITLTVITLSGFPCKTIIDLLRLNKALAILSVSTPLAIRLFIFYQILARVILEDNF